MSYDLTSVTSQVEAGWSTPRRASSKRRCELSTAWAAWPQELRTSKIKEISRIKRLFKSIFKIIFSIFSYLFLFFQCPRFAHPRADCEGAMSEAAWCAACAFGGLFAWSQWLCLEFQSILATRSNFTQNFNFSFELLVQSTLYMVYNIVYSILTTCVCLVCFRSLFMSKRSSVYLPIQAKKLNQKRFCVSLLWRPTLVQAGFRVLAFDLPEPW